MKNIAPKKISDEDLEETKLKRESILNPPDIEPGMEDDDDDWGDDSDWDFGEDDDDDFGGDSFGLSDSSLGGPMGGMGMGGGMGSPMGGMGMGGGMGSPYGSPYGMGGMQQQNQQPVENPEDKFWATVFEGGKGSFNFAKELVESFKEFDVYRKLKFGRNTQISSLVIIFFSILGMIFKVGSFWNYIVASLISMGLTMPIFMSALEDIQQGNVPEETYDEPEEEIDLEDDYMDDDFLEEDEDDDEDFNDEEEDLFSFEDDELFESDFEEEPEKVLPESLSPKEILEQLNTNMGMMTREYLFENITAALKYRNKDFADIQILNEDSREFLSFANILESAAENLMPKSAEEYPQLLEVKDKLFYTSLTITRVKWLRKPDKLIDEIVNICRFDEEKGKIIDENIFGYGHVVGKKIYIKIMKGETALITIKDAFDKVREEMIDTDNHIPVVFGINEEGDVIWEDLKKINSMLVTGMPRSGKSWFVKSVLAQMTMFLSPEELHFRLLDPKADISDFKSMSMPHIRKFVSSDKDILEELRWVVKKEGVRRKKIMKEAGFINYWDLKKQKPEIKMPLLYVVIDEVVTLADRMDKETKKEFQGLLSQLVSQLPALGIRIFMIPHVVKNHILKKTITDLIPCRVSVRGDADHIESSTGTKGSDFVHKLTNQGDMAVKLNNDKTQFVHGAVIGETNSDMENFFNFLTQFWLKVDPNYIRGSKYEKERKENKNGSEEMNFNDSEEEEIDLFEVEETEEVEDDYEDDYEDESGDARIFRK